MLRTVHEQLKDSLAATTIQVFGQGVESNNRTKLTKLFMDSPACVLLGTSSFWEGVDIPGEALSCLAIIRLPFQPPNHPLTEARCELIKAEGKNPFMVHSLPQAVLKFKQGFGRLIRSATDRGIVIVYDRRILDTYYGKYFLYSLPGPKIEHMNDAYMVGRIQEWFTNESEMEDNA
jgi:ATP-dependent DNA helicase DinG